MMTHKIGIYVELNAPPRGLHEFENVGDNDYISSTSTPVDASQLNLTDEDYVRRDDEDMGDNED